MTLVGASNPFGKTKIFYNCQIDPRRTLTSTFRSGSRRRRLPAQFDQNDDESNQVRHTGGIHVLDQRTHECHLFASILENYFRIL